MNDKGYEYNEAYFASQSTNRMYAGPLDMPWIEEGMCMAQWRNGIVSHPFDPGEEAKFYHQKVLKNGEYRDLLCFWRVTAIKVPIKLSQDASI